MKHSIKITIILIAIFVLSQLIGLGLLAFNAQQQIYTEPTTNQTSIVVHYNETVAGPRPDVSGYGSLLYIAIAVALGTLLLLFLIKFKIGGKIWKAWYFLAIMIAIAIALGVFVKPWIAYLIAGILAALKLYYKKPLIHNTTEILMYAGIALLITPLFNVLWAAALLVLISIYDIYAVWKSKHMVKLAKFTSKEKLFPGIALEYNDKTKSKQGSRHHNQNHKQELKKGKTTSSKTISVRKETAKKINRNKQGKRQAILGGGDVIFPLIYTGTILNGLLSVGYTKPYAYLLSLIVTVATTGALTLLFAKAKKEKFYPAMPFISAGCFVGTLILFGVLMIV